MKIIKKEDVSKASEIKKEIDELEYFIEMAEKVYKGKIIKRDTKYIFSFSLNRTTEEYNMNTNIKNKVLDVLREHLNDLYKQLEDI